jgi:ABC-type branched-subunit amino acid transport system substrate-binding protein
MKKLVLACGVVVAASAFVLSGALATPSTTPGVTSTSVLIGGTFPLSGPASGYAPIAVGMQAYFSYINFRKGKDGKRGVYGRKIVFKYLDDGYVPANAVQLTRQLVEQDGVFAMVGGLGTDNQVAVRDYLNQMKVPQLFVSTGATTFGADHTQYPWTIGWQPTYNAEGTAFAQWINAHDQGAKIGVLYQNDGYGHDYLDAFKAALRNKNQVIDEEGYEVTTPSVQTQIVKLKASGADTFLVLATPKFTIQGLVIAYKIGWKPKLYVNSVSATDTFLTIAATAAGSNDAVNGVITDNYLKDPGDPTQRKDPAVKLFFGLMNKFGPGGVRLTDILYLYGMAKAHTFVTTLYQAGMNPTRASLIQAATHLNEKNPYLLPGITIKTTSSHYFPICKSELTRWNNGNFSRVSGLIKGC